MREQPGRVVTERGEQGRSADADWGHRRVQTMRQVHGAKAGLRTSWEVVSPGQGPDQGYEARHKGACRAA